MDSFKKLVVISPHRDDFELGCGGIAQRFEQVEIIQVTMQNADRQAEYAASLKHLEKFCVVTTTDLPFKDGTLNLEPLPKLSSAIEECIPDDATHVMIPFESLHQDHQATYHASLIALRNCKATIMTYEYAEGLSNFSNFEPNIFTELTETQLAVKSDMLNCYKSQLRNNRNTESVKALATIRGFAAGVAYAEAFKLVRTVL